ncbi:hypothetical protein ACLOJK_038855 [Asimina triloba]
MLPCSIRTRYLGPTLHGCSVDDPLVRLLLSWLDTNRICPILARCLICFLLPCLGSTCSLCSSLYVFIWTSLRLPFQAPTCSRVHPQIWPEKMEGSAGRSVTPCCYDDRPMWRGRRCWVLPLDGLKTLLDSDLGVAMGYCVARFHHD